MAAATWTGVYPALTTAFDAAGDVDLRAVQGHARWLVEEGCSGLVPLGSLGRRRAAPPSGLPGSPPLGSRASGTDLRVVDPCAPSAHREEGGRAFHRVECVLGGQVRGDLTVGAPPSVI